MLGTQRKVIFFDTLTDQLITVSAYNSVLAYPVYRNTKLLLKEINRSVYTTVELVQTTVC